MNVLSTVLCLALVAALPCAAQVPFVVVDQERDVPLDVENGDGLNITTITFSREGSSKIGIDFRMSGAVPKNASGDYVIIAYLDIDDNAETGVLRGDIATDLDVFVYKASGTSTWEHKVNKTSSLLAKESFQITKFSQYKDGFTLNVSSPLFKKALRIRGHVESISNGKTVDRAPAESFFTWGEAGQPTNSAPAQE